MGKKIMFPIFLVFFKFVLFADITIIENKLGDLWILGIGINSYKNSSIPYLANPVNDTIKLVNSLKYLKGIHFENVNSLIITDENASKENILDSFEYFNQVKHNDTVLLYINAHGISSTEGIYYFYPNDANIDIPNILDNTIDVITLISIYDIMEVFNIEADVKKFLFIETCGSGGAINYMPNRDIIILAACGQDEFSVEANFYGSIFTNGFVEWLNENKDGPIIIDTVFNFMYNYVLNINRRLGMRFVEIQHPKLFIPPILRNPVYFGREY